MNIIVIDVCQKKAILQSSFFFLINTIFLLERNQLTICLFVIVKFTMKKECKNSVTNKCI